MNDNPNRDIPAELTAEITRYGGLNPHLEPNWRVVWAQNVRMQTFGVMRHIPLISEEADLEGLEPERITTGEMWLPRYCQAGAILEKWFSASIWGDVFDWENELNEDGGRRMGEFPRQGGYIMVSTEFLTELPAADYWKEKIQEELCRMMAAPVDPATHLKVQLFLERRNQERREQEYLLEVDHVHRSQVAPALMTVSRNANLMREELGYVPVG